MASISGLNPIILDETLHVLGRLMAVSPLPLSTFPWSLWLLYPVQPTLPYHVQSFLVESMSLQRGFRRTDMLPDVEASQLDTVRRVYKHTV